MHLYRKRLIFVFFIGTVFLLVTWLFNGETSPILEYAANHVTMGNLLVTLNLPPLFLGFLASGNVHQPSEVMFYTAVLLQWFALGYLISMLVFRRR